MFRGTRFRSRLEARWALMFTMFGWLYEYEPLDLGGYIPDFVLKFDEPLLVEVKPALRPSDLRRHFAKIEASGWPGEALVVGATVPLAETRCLDLTRGLACRGDCWSCAGLGALMLRGASSWCDAVLFRCPLPRCGISIFEPQGIWRCRRCLGWEKPLGGIVLEAEGLVQGWKIAGNAFQWRRPR